jgi:hypothetical protein
VPDGRCICAPAPTASTLPFYGVLLAPTVVLAAYGSTYASPYDLFRPLATLTLSAAFLFALLGGATRRWHAAAAPTTSVHPTRPSPTWFRTLFAARGHSFPDDVTTREVFPALLGL